MELALTVAVALSWLAIVFLGWLVFLLLGRHGRTLLSHDDLRERLARAEARLDALAAEAHRGHAADAHALHQHGAEPPVAGLPLGSPAPEFALPDLDGRQRQLREFLGQPLLVLFFSPECGYCLQMAPSLGQLPTTGPRVLVIGQGDPEVHRRLASEHSWRCPVVLQQEWEVLSAYQATGTPTGYLLDAEGRIASGLAVGADAVLRLLDAVPSHGSNGHAAELTAESLREQQLAAAERARAAGLPVRESRLNREGLRAGTPAPDFNLPDLAGAQRTLGEFRGRRVLLVFSDPDCGPCQVLAPKLVHFYQWHRRDDLEVIVISRGDPAVNRALAREHGLPFPVLLQKHWEVSRDYAMFATPVAYLIDQQGRIARDVAVGADAILQLV